MTAVASVGVTGPAKWRDRRAELRWGMHDAWAVALATAAVIGALLQRPASAVPLGVVAGAALLALGLRRPMMLVLAVGVLASGLSARAMAGLRSPEPEVVEAIVTLVSDPVDLNGGVRADARLGARRVELVARGSSAGPLRARLAGERVAVVGELQPLRGPARRFAVPRHVAVRLAVHEVTGWREGAAVSRLANGLRRLLVRGAESLGRDSRALFTGFVLGDDRDERPEVIDDFRASGLSHLLVVSGENVAFVLGAAGLMLRRLTLGARLALGIAVLGLFGVLTRWEPSVLRAEAMAALALYAAYRGRGQSALRLLALAVTALVLVDPLLVHSLGFGLSVAASLGIALLAAPIARRLPGPRWLATAVSVTVAAQVGVAPLLVPAFGGIPVASLPANLLAVPAAGPVMMWGLIAGIPAGLIGGWPARIIHLPTAVLVGWVAGVARRFAALPLGTIDGRVLLALLAAAAVAVIAERVSVRSFARALRRAGRLAIAGVLGAVVVAATRPALGDAMAMPLSPGANIWRIDGATVLVVSGGDPARVLTALRRARLRRFDLLVDAATGNSRGQQVVAALRSRFTIGAVLNAASVSPGDRVRVGGLIVAVEAVWPSLRVTVLAVARARGPPGRRPVRPRYGRPVRLVLGDREYDLTHRALVMGILNRTTDSFFDKGSYWSFDAFLQRAYQLVDEGADILDVGGVKAGPGAEVGEAEELDRVVPAIEALHERFDVPLSVDTWRASVAAAAYGAGAVIGNDISGFADPDYLRVSAAAGASVVATHIRLRPRVPDPEPVYPEGVRAAVRSFLADRAALAEAAGIDRFRIMLDAGIDLGKTWQQSVVLLRDSAALCELGYPVLLSASNKTFLGRLLDLEIDQRGDASLGAAALGVGRGCRIVRAHDVRGTRRVCDVLAGVLAAP